LASHERWYLDAWLDRIVVHPFQRLFGLFDSLERKWTGFLSGDSLRESDRVPAHDEVIEELRL